MQSQFSNKTKRLILGILALIAIVSIVLSFNQQTSKAAGITNINISLTNESISAAGVGVTIEFTPNTPITNGSVINIDYDTAFTGGASLTDGDISVTGTNITSSTESSIIAGSFESVLTTSGTVTSTVTVTIDNAPGLTNPSSAGNYQWSISVNIGGTSVNYDNGAGLAYVGDANDVNVTGIIGSTLDLQMYVQDSSTPLVLPYTCNLGALNVGAVSSCSYDIGFSTNSSGGATVKVAADGQLRNGLNNIAACTGTNCNGDGTTGVTAGSAEYGFVISNTGTGCSTTPVAPYGTADQAVPLSSTDFFSNNTLCDGAASGSINKRIEVTHKASINAATVVGTYNQLVTYTIFAN